MADTRSSSTGVGASMPRQASRTAPQPTGWVGWIVFAATMMAVIGGFQMIQGFVALFKDSYFVVAKSGLAVEIDYTAWGWTHLALGAILLATGIALFSGRMWARVIGVIVAGLSALVNFAFIEAYPWWSAIVIALDVFVIWALTVHGQEMKSV